MDVKDLQNEATLGERNNDGSKYASSGVTLPYSRNKSYQDVSSVSLGKVDAQTSRPCAVIGPDRVLPPPVSNDTFKKSAYEAWYADSVYRHPPEYPHKMTNYHTPIRNISPRQTFQENMQRIMVPPSYSSLKGNEEHHYPMDKNVSLPKNTKPNIPIETKYCEVPYSGSLTSNEQKGVRNTEQCASNVNPVLARSVPQGWPSHVRPPRPYGAPELYQYPEYTNCAGPRPVPMTRPHRTTHEDPSHGYPDPYYHDGNIRFKPYTTVKDRYPQARYEFIGNYPSPFHPPSAFPPHKYDMPKSIPQSYAYPQVPLKYLDSRIPDPLMEGYQRPAQQNNYNLPFHNQMIHPAYGPVLGNCIQNKFPRPPEGSVKSVAPNKPPYDTNKIYAEYENARTKGFPVSENYFFNEMQRPPHNIKSQVMSNYPVNMHGIPAHPYYRKDSSTINNYEYMTHFRNIDSSLLSQSRIASQFSPNAITISPPDTNLTLESTPIQGGTQEDCGYMSQSPSASMRSVDYIRTANEFYRRYDPRYGPTIRPPPMMTKHEQNPNGNSKDKKDLDVRQFLQMWNEVDDENAENANKEVGAQLLPNEGNKSTTQYETVKNQDQLYVLGLVNVPSEELGKYEHIQKVSKLPENIKGYNSIELLNQFEEVIESTNVNSFKTKSANSRDINYQMSMKNSMPHHSLGMLPRPVSPLDVEAKISQSVIHKEVGCNFEIKPCSPKMLNVEAATPIQNLLGERAIEKVSNPLIVSPSILHEDDKLNCKMLNQQDQIKSPNENVQNTSCKMTNTQFNNDSVRPNYSIQDLESNAGVCLASLPRLDNDIELNFPEVNQQFINANKGESVITATKDLPSLINIDPIENDCPKIESHLSDGNYEFPSIIESEREFSKLSKYRKIKKCGPESLEKETTSFTSTQNMRTDSVIIKNPENLKMYEQNKDVLTTGSFSFTQDKVILNKENFIDEVGTDIEFSNKLDNTAIDTPMDIAIDFSLNKNDNNNLASGAIDYYIGNRFKSPKINKIKHRPKMSQNEKNNCVKDQIKETDIQPELQQTIEAEAPIKCKTENESKQLPESHDYHESEPEKPLNSINQQFNNQSEFSLHKKCDKINEEKKCSLKPQLGNDLIPIEEDSKYVKNKNYEYRKETNNIDFNTVNYEDTNISTQIEVNNHMNTSNFKEDHSSALTSDINENALKSHKTSSFELFSDESDEYDTDSTSNEANKMKEKLGPTKNEDNDEKVENSDTKEDEIDNNAMMDTNEENRETSCLLEQTPDVKDATSHKIGTVESLSEMGAKDKKSDVEGAIKPNREEETSDAVDETDKEVENSAVEDDISEIKQLSSVEKELTETVNVGENSDIEKYINQEEAKSNIKEKLTKADEVQKNVHEDLNETVVQDDEENLNKLVKIEDKFGTDEIDVEKTRSIESEVEETSRINSSLSSICKSINQFKDVIGDNVTTNSAIALATGARVIEDVSISSPIRDIKKLPLENKSQENAFDSCKTIINDTDKVLDVSDTNKIYNNVETFDESTEIIHVDKITAIESANNENSSNSCQAFENNTEISKNEGNSIDSVNKHVIPTSKTPLSNNDSLNECKTLKNFANEIQLEVDTKVLSEVKESFVKSNKNTNNKCEHTHEQLHEYVEETKYDITACKASKFSLAASMKIDKLAESEENINKLSNPNEDSKQLQPLFQNSKNVSLENSDQLPQPFKNSLTIISPLNSDDDSSNSPHPHLDISNEIDSLDNNDSYCHSSIAESNISFLGKELACKKLEDRTSLKSALFTNVTNTAMDIDSEKSTHIKNIYDFKIKSGLKKELFSPFIQKLISENEGYGSNVLVSTKRNYPSSGRVSSEVVEHKKRDNHIVNSIDATISNENTSINVEVMLNNTNCKSLNQFKDVIDDNVTTNSAIGLATDARVIEDVSKSSPIRDIKICTSSIKSDLCSEMTVHEHFNTHSKLTSTHLKKYASDEITVTNNTILDENTEQTESNVPSPNLNLESNFDAENNETFEINDISHIHNDQQPDDNATATEPMPMKETEINDHFTPNNELNIEGDLNVEAAQDSGNNKYVVRSNRSCLKRSLSDSALDSFSDTNDALYSGWQPKRSKKKLHNILEPDIIFESNCHSHRRKSISSIYNEQNLSFCILIDNDCIIAEEEESEEQNEVCFTEISEGCITDLHESVNDYDNIMSPKIIGCPEESNPEYSLTQEVEDKSFEESWVDDVGCIETVVSDVAEDITISASSSPERINSENEDTGIFMNSEHTDKVKHIYGDKMCNDDIMFLETLYRTPQMNVNKVINRESQISDECIQYYNKDSLEKVLSGCHSHEDLRSDLEPIASDANSAQCSNMQLEEQLDTRSVSPAEVLFPMRSTYSNNDNGNDESSVTDLSKTQYDTVHSCESSIDNVFSYDQRDDFTTYTSSTSPEVSSTTSEEKNSGILLKITNYKGSRISQINDFEPETKSISCKFTELNDYSSSQNFKSNRPLITKAAQKYIPPLKETFSDLKIRLPLPQHSLLRLKQLKLLKDESKLKCNIKSKPDIPKKPKPKFEDVLKSIDEIQFKMHKEKSKKTKKSIPKVVIKKNENGSHYASTTNREPFNPDLTGRKWQPWVFLEKNHFIDKMALRNKRKAIFNHRKNTYVLAEKFRKYKSIGNAKFIISQPNVHNSSIGHLKCTIRLKHTY